MVWRSMQVAVAARCRGLAAGIGISMRTRERSERSACTLVGTVVGMVAALLAGLIPSYPIGSFLVLAVGLGPVNTYLSASKMSTKWMKPMNITSSFSNRENIRR